MAKRTSSSLKCTAHRTVQHYSGWRQCGGGSMVAVVATVAAAAAAAPPSTVLEPLRRPLRNKDLKARHRSKTQILKSWHIQFWAHSILITFQKEHIPKWAFLKKTTFQKERISKKIFQKVHIPFWAYSKKIVFRFNKFHFDHILRRAHSTVVLGALKMIPTFLALI